MKQRYEVEKRRMALSTRQNPETGELEVLVSGVWTPFQEYRERQIDTAYLNSIRFLRDRLGEQAAEEMTAQETKPLAIAAQEEP
jgi:hypothetical protein